MVCKYPTYPTEQTNNKKSGRWKCGSMHFKSATPFYGCMQLQLTAAFVIETGVERLCFSCGIKNKGEDG